MRQVIKFFCLGCLCYGFPRSHRSLVSKTFLKRGQRVNIIGILGYKICYRFLILHHFVKITIVCKNKSLPVSNNTWWKKLKVKLYIIFMSHNSLAIRKQEAGWPDFTHAQRFSRAQTQGSWWGKVTDSKLFEKKLNSKKPHTVLRTPTRSRFLEKVLPNGITLQSLISKHNLLSGPAKHGDTARVQSITHAQA